MNTRLTEFQRVNGGEDDLLPLYITKEPNKTTDEAYKRLWFIIKNYEKYPNNFALYDNRFFIWTNQQWRF